MKNSSAITEYITMCIGECIGTFILVFFGISTVAVAVLFGALSGLLQVAIVWGIGVTLAIYASRALSCAHLNPAVTLGMVVAKRMKSSSLPGCWISQLIGGVIAGLLLLLIFHAPILQYEAANAIVRGAPESIKTAMFFGEYFPNPVISGGEINLGLGPAMLVEGVGTFLLVLMIFLLTDGCNVGRPTEALAPLFIGATVTAVIAIFAPLTQAGINPARDFGPRLVAFLAGWDRIAIPGPKNGFFWVYILAPLLGGIAAALLFRFVLFKFASSGDTQSSPCCSPPPE